METNPLGTVPYTAAADNLRTSVSEFPEYISSNRRRVLQKNVTKTDIYWGLYHIHILSIWPFYEYLYLI